MLLPDRFARRVIMTAVGVSLTGVAVGFFQASNFGVDPYTSFALGLWGLFPGLSYGIFYILLNAVFLIADFFLDRHRIGIATFVNLFLLGYIITFSKNALDALFPNPTLPIRTLLLAIGLVLLCIASSLYYTSDLGVSTYDVIPLALGDRNIRFAGRAIPFKYWRIFCDLLCVIVGFACGSVPGICTLIVAFFTGPLVAFFNVHLAQPLLYGRAKEAA